jgi:microcompartment protein CcmK/EutM
MRAAGGGRGRLVLVVAGSAANMSDNGSDHADDADRDVTVVARDPVRAAKT